MPALSKYTLTVINKPEQWRELWERFASMQFAAMDDPFVRKHKNDRSDARKALERAEELLRQAQIQKRVADIALAKEEAAKNKPYEGYKPQFPI